MFVFVEAGYQFTRNRGRNILLGIVSALLCGCIAFYLSNITASQEALDNINETTPAVVHVLSHDAGRTRDLVITAWRYDVLAENGVENILATSQACGAYSPQAKEQLLFNGGDTRLLALTHRDAAEIYTDDFFTFANGYDSTLLEGDDPVCLVDTAYAGERGLAIGDELSMPIALNKYDGFVMPVYVPVPDVTMRIVGTFHFDKPTEFSADIYVPSAWLRAHTEASGELYSFNTLEGTLVNSMALNEFKAAIPAMGFTQPFLIREQEVAGGIRYKPIMDHTTGDKLYVDDEQFIKTAERLGQTIQQFQAFMLPFFIAIILLVTLAIFLVLRGARRDMAISCSLGRQKLLIGLSHFLAALAAETIGALIFVPVIAGLAGLGIGMAFGIAGAFLLCALLGNTLGLWALLRFDPLKLLISGE